MMDRRRFLGLGARVVGGLAVASVIDPLLAACSSGSSSSTTSATSAAAASGGATTSAAPKDLGKIAYQLGWIKNFQFDGDYIADNKGYYKAAGIEVDLVAGGPNVSVDPVIVSGKALVGNSSPDFTASAVAQGASLKIIGAQYQKSPFAMISRAEKPINTPQDMIGKTVGIQTVNATLWHAFLKLNKMESANIKTVPVTFDFTPLFNGGIDGFFGYSTDDVIHMRSLGHNVTYFLFADYGYKLFTSTYTVARSSLTDPTKRAQIVAFMKGDIKGWQDAVADPALGAQLTVDVYGKGNGLNAAEQTESAKATNDLIVNDVTKQHGLFWMSPETINDTVSSLAASGIKASPDLFTTEILQEVFKGGTSVR
jgi:ABC-type nitrate/sulfonate/bicarbonate transport system substrate-binding protein